MAKINYLKDDKPRKESDWKIVGKLWPHKSKKDALSGRFGVARKEGDKLVQLFDEITIKPDDPVIVRPNTNMREGKNDPSHILVMLKDNAKAAKSE